MRRKMEAKRIIIFLIVVLVAYYLYLPTWINGLGRGRRVVRLFLQIGLVSGWYLSVRKRIIHPQIRRYLNAISALIIFWLGIRHIKWQLAYPDWLGVYFWYSFYLPMIFIPLFFFLCTSTMRKNENYRPSKLRYLPELISTVLFLFVFTNNAHELVFSFKDEPSGVTGAYSYGNFYYVILFWIGVCLIGTIYHIIRKSRILHLKQGLLLAALTAIFLGYGIGYMVLPGTSFLHTYLTDMTAIYCYMILIFFEFCLYNRLIPNNFGYEELFSGSYLKAAIEDAEGNIIVRSRDFQELPSDTRSQAKDETVLMGNYKVSSSKVLDGRIYWEEDVSEILNTIEDLQDMKLELEGSNEIKKIEADLAKKKQRLKEMNRIYDRIQAETSQQIQFLSNLLAAFDHKESEEEKREILKQIVVVGAYLKRRNNLLLLSEKDDEVPPSELLLCFRETMEALEAGGIVTNLNCSLRERMPIQAAMHLYDYFERFLEMAGGSFSAVVVNLEFQESAYMLRINTDASAGLFGLSNDPYGTVEIEQDEAEWFLQYELPGGTEK